MNTYNASVASRPRVAQKQTWKQKNRRLYHFLLALAGIAMTYLDWGMRTTEHLYYVKTSFVGPAVAIFFGGSALFPGLFKAKKPLWYVLVVVAIVAGALNFIAMSQ